MFIFIVVKIVTGDIVVYCSYYNCSSNSRFKFVCCYVYYKFCIILLLVLLNETKFGIVTKSSRGVDAIISQERNYRIDSESSYGVYNFFCFVSVEKLRFAL